MSFENIKLKLPEFVPIFKNWSGHSQTLLGHLLKSPNLKDIKNINLENRVIKLSDGDELSLQLFRGSQPFTLSIFHGLGGDIDADYMQRTALLAYKLGWSFILVNHRSVSPFAKSQRSYHSGRGGDISDILKWSNIWNPQSTQIVIGFSMSGSILLNLVTGKSGDCLPKYAITVNAPIDLKNAADNLTKGFSKIYDIRFFLKLKKMIHLRIKQNQFELNKSSKLPVIGKTKDIDRLYTAPLNGFESRDDYYQKCSVVNDLNKIKVKTFILTSEDDPFISAKQYQLVKWNPFVHFTMTRYGGHMGYISKNNIQNSRRWLDCYIETVLKKISDLESGQMS